jgi:hypothetical protein
MLCVRRKKVYAIKMLNQQSNPFTVKVSDGQIKLLQVMKKGKILSLLVVRDKDVRLRRVCRAK